MKNNFVKLVASGLYSGYSPIIPGTTGTVPAWLIAYFLIGDNPLILFITFVVTSFISVWSATLAESIYGHDAKKIVMDEWAGMFLTLMFVPFSLTNYLIAFVVFRVFDVLKIPPASQAEKLPKGWGVTMDDVVAGVQACFCTNLIIFLMERF